MKERKQHRTLRSQILMMILVGVLIPVIILMIVVVMLVRGHVHTQTQRTILTSMEKAADITALRLEDCVKASKDASYLPQPADLYAKDRGHAEELYSDTSLFLRQMYKFNSSFRATFLIYTEDPSRTYYTTNRGIDSTFSAIRYFEETVKEPLLDYAKEIDTKTCFTSLDGHIYMVRNVMSKNFTPYAVLIMQLDTDAIFDSLKSVWEYQGMYILVDGEFLFSEDMTEEEQAAANATAKEDGIRGRFAVVKRISGELSQRVTAVAAYDKRAAEMESRTLLLTMIVLLASLIPLIVTLLIFINRHVTEPVSALVKASETIRSGNYGVKVALPQHHDEVADLVSNFNEMSEQLKTQFDTIFVEEIALRDANIHALQSQINPHFLNNTLEIINWECRMNGNEKASLMIEAPSTMMDATMDRDKRPLIPLSEELNYVKAYVYIISCRFGSRFHYEETIDETLLNEQIPRLVIQPIIENAVEHGTAPDGSIQVSLSVERSAGGELVIRVRNQNEPTEEDRTRIGELLADDETPEDLHHTEIGIRNVNRRLKILFGPESGLHFDVDEHGNTVFELIKSEPEE